MHSRWSFFFQISPPDFIMIEERRCTKGKGKIKQCQQRLIACIEMSARVISERNHSKKWLIQKAGFWWKRGFLSQLTIKELTKNTGEEESVKKKTSIGKGGGRLKGKYSPHSNDIRVLLFGNITENNHDRKPDVNLTCDLHHWVAPVVDM